MCFVVFKTVFFMILQTGIIATMLNLIFVFLSCSKVWVSPLLFPVLQLSQEVSKSVLYPIISQLSQEVSKSVLYPIISQLSQEVSESVLYPIISQLT
jgi:hypothetical protein